MAKPLSGTRMSRADGAHACTGVSLDRIQLNPPAPQRILEKLGALSHVNRGGARHDNEDIQKRLALAVFPKVARRKSHHYLHRSSTLVELAAMQFQTFEDVAEFYAALTYFHFTEGTVTLAEMLTDRLSRILVNRKLSLQFFGKVLSCHHHDLVDAALSTLSEELQKQGTLLLDTCPGNEWAKRVRIKASWWRLVAEIIQKPKHLLKVIKRTWAVEEEPNVPVRQIENDILFIDRRGSKENSAEFERRKKEIERGVITGTGFDMEEDDYEADWAGEPNGDWDGEADYPLEDEVCDGEVGYPPTDKATAAIGTHLNGVKLEGSPFEDEGMDEDEDDNEDDIMPVSSDPRNAQLMFLFLDLWAEVHPYSTDTPGFAQKLFRLGLRTFTTRKNMPSVEQLQGSGDERGSDDDDNMELNSWSKM